MFLLVIVFATISLLSIFLIQVVTFIFQTQNQCHVRSPPGPLALPFIGHLHLLGPNMHQSLNNLSSRYGPLIQLRLGSQLAVVVSTPELAKQFLKTHELSFSSRPLSPAIQLIKYNASFAFAPHGSYWKFIKKLCTCELLGIRGINNFRPLRALEMHRFLQHLALKAKAGKVVNVTEEIIKVTNNILTQMMFGLRCVDTNGEAKETRIVVREVTQIFGELDVSNNVWFFRKLDLQGIKKRSLGIHRRFDALLEKIIRERERVRIGRKECQKDGVGVEVKNDLLDMLLDVMESDNADVNFTRDHLKALILDLFTAGTDTTAGAIDWTLAEVINNPRVLEKAQMEIHEVVGNQRLVEESDVPDLPYIQAILKETFRLHPVIPLITRKSTNDSIINGYKIRAETKLFVNSWSIGRNPKYWECPMEFRPERLLGPRPSDDGEKLLGLDRLVDLRGQHFELLPFGAGRRGCPGMLLSMQALPTFVAAIIQCFHWEMPIKVDMTERPGLTAPRANDLVCTLIPRIDLEGILSIASEGNKDHEITRYP